MTYAFRADEKTAKRVRAIVPKLISGANDALNVQAVASSEHHVVFPTLAGWWRFINRTAEAMMTLFEQGYTVEVAPLMRNLIGHAYAMHWLADNGEPAVFALAEASWRSKKNLLDNLVEVNWQLPAASVDIGEKPDFGFTTDEERKRHGQLLGELKNFMNMMRGYGDPMMYPIYRNLSSFSHPTDLTAGVYLQQAADGRLIVHQEAHTDRLADVCWMPIPLLQAASVISRMITGDPMKKLVTEACRDLGLPENLLPQRP
jgi:hypothetical protein